MIVFASLFSGLLGLTTSSPLPRDALDSFTFSVPGLEGGVEISGLQQTRGQEEPSRVSISIPGGLGSLFGSSGGQGSGSQGLDDFFGFNEDSDSSPGGVSLSFNFPRGGSLSNILRQSSSIFEDNTPFGLNGFFLGGDMPSLSGFNNLFSGGSRRRPTTPAPVSLGKFSVLSGGPWDNFRSMFSLYTMPEHPGYREVFGPVYGAGEGCGLCHLFPSYGSGSFITLEIVTESFYDNYHYKDVFEALPGGFVSKVNNTCIQVLDSEGDGVFFLLNDDEEEKKENTNNEEDVDEDVPEIMVVEEGPEEGEVEYVDVNGQIPEIMFIDEDENPTNPPEPEETTTKIPLSVLDPSRFDIANDKITSSTLAVTNAEEDIPTTTKALPTSTTEAEMTATTTMKTTTTEAVTTTTERQTTTPTTTTVSEDETTTLLNDPTLNVDPGLLA